MDINNAINNIWKCTITNSSAVEPKLKALNLKVTDRQGKTNVSYQNLVRLIKLDSEKIKLKVKEYQPVADLETTSINISKIIKSYENINVYDNATVDSFSDEVISAIHPILTIKFADVEVVNNVMSRLKDTLKLIVLFYADSPDEEEKIKTYSINAFTTLGTHLIEMVVLILSLPEGQKKLWLNILESVKNIAHTVLDENHLTHEDPLVSDPESIKKKVSKIKEELSKNNFLPNTNSKLANIPLDNFFTAGIKFTDINDVYKIEDFFEKLKEGVGYVFEQLEETYADNNRITKELRVVKSIVIKWLCLPEDFRPNNWIEVIHVVVQNIQFSLRTSLKGVLPVEQFVLPFIHKLDYILSQVDNETFKLLITPKEEPQIHEVYLPDILDPEESEEKYSQPLPSPAVTDMSQTRTEIPSAVDTASTDTADEPETPPKRLTYGLVIDFLCFDKTHGATAKMDGELADVIKDLYYWDWLSGKLYYLEDELMSLFDKEKYWGYWEDIKTKLLDENGVNIGAFIDYLMDKGVSIINSVLDFIKETIQYFIDEVFKLAKAILDFFQKVDLPPVARDLLKKIPAFDKMPDNVTLLHILAAIPYTLYQEFVHFVVPSELQTA